MYEVKRIGSVFRTVFQGRYSKPFRYKHEAIAHGKKLVEDFNAAKRAYASLTSSASTSSETVEIPVEVLTLDTALPTHITTQDVINTLQPIGETKRRAGRPRKNNNNKKSHNDARNSKIQSKTN